MRFVAFGGDGGTYDIGLQALSGAMERGHDMVYVCYDNGAYMNTGIQRSSATPMGAWATTSEVGKAQAGQDPAPQGPHLDHRRPRRPVRRAGARSAHWKDLTTKAEKAFAVDGPAFLNVFAPCPRGWRIPSSQTVEIAKLAVQTGFWPLFEVEDGEWRQTVEGDEPQAHRGVPQASGPVQAPLHARERGASGGDPGRRRSRVERADGAVRDRVASRDNDLR